MQCYGFGSTVLCQFLLQKQYRGRTEVHFVVGGAPLVSVSPVSRISFKYLTKMEAQRYPSLAKGDNFGIPNVKQLFTAAKKCLSLSILMLENVDVIYF